MLRRDPLAERGRSERSDPRHAQVRAPTPKTGFRQVFPLRFNFAGFNEVRIKFPCNVYEVVASG